jgi:hypothetical protein
MDPTTPLDVFITSSRHDSDAADKICEALEATGVRCWMAHRDILPGMGYLGPILEALDQCRIVIVIASSNMTTSNVYLLDRAAGRRVPLLWLMLDTATPPAEFRRFQALASRIDVSIPPLESRLGPLADRVRSLLDQNPKTAATPAASTEERNLPHHSAGETSEGDFGLQHGKAATTSPGLRHDVIDQAAIESALRTVATLFSKIDGRLSRDVADDPSSGAAPTTATTTQEQLPPSAEQPEVTPPTTRPISSAGGKQTKRRFGLVLSVLMLLALGAITVFGRRMADFLMRLRIDSAH